MAFETVLLSGGGGEGWGRSGRGGDGEAHRERRAVPHLALDLDPAVVLLGDPPRDREAEAGPAGRAGVAVAGAVGAVEPLEEVGEVLGVDAHAVVADADDDLVPSFVGASFDPRAEADL